jgi:hypothetical protein
MGSRVWDDAGRIAFFLAIYQPWSDELFVDICIYIATDIYIFLLCRISSIWLVCFLQKSKEFLSKKGPFIKEVLQNCLKLELGKGQLSLGTKKNQNLI